MSHHWPDTLSPFKRNDGVTLDPATTPGNRWPTDYVELLAFMDGGEGFVGEQYLRIFSHHDAAWLNEQSPLRDMRDGLFIFGSTGGGEAFAFDERARNRVVRVPFIPLTREYLRPVAEELRSWLTSASASGPMDASHVGKEIHEIKPIVFGGDPVDAQNKVLLDLRTYVEAVVWFNNLYRQMRPEQVGHNPPMQRTGAAGIFSGVRKWFGGGPGR